MRADAEPSPGQSPTKATGSYNRCDIFLPNLIQIRSKEERLLDGGAYERRQLAERFWALVDRRGPSECWIWRRSCQKSGYGQFTYRFPDKQHVYYAHRVAWLLTYGESAGPMVLCHHCDNPPCVNPNHLFKGTPADNLADARRKGRLDESRPRTRALTLADRLAIWRATGDRGLCVALARRYGVTKGAISLIRRGRFAGCPDGVLETPAAQAEQAHSALDSPSGPFQRVPFVRRPIVGEVR